MEKEETISFQILVQRALLTRLLELLRSIETYGLRSARVANHEWLRMHV